MGPWPNCQISTEEHEDPRTVRCCDRRREKGTPHTPPCRKAITAQYGCLAPGSACMLLPHCLHGPSDYTENTRNTLSLGLPQGDSKLFLPASHSLPACSLHGLPPSQGLFLPTHASPPPALPAASAIGPSTDLCSSLTPEKSSCLLLPASAPVPGPRLWACLTLPRLLRTIPKGELSVSFQHPFQHHQSRLLPETPRKCGEDVETLEH